jgi:hypothetical protein
MSRIVCGLTTFAVFLPAFAFANLVPAGSSDLGGQGFGTVFNVLTLQANPSEAGKVAWNGSGDTMTGAASGPNCGAPNSCIGPDTGLVPQSGKTATATVSGLGWTQGGNIIIGLNVNQTGQSTVDLTSLTLTFYNSAGTQVGQSFSLAAPDNGLSQSGQPGNGNAYYVFVLDGPETQIINSNKSLYLNSTNHVGLAAQLGNISNDGAETFALANNPVPEPGFYGALAIGLSGLYFAAQRFGRKQV